MFAALSKSVVAHPGRTVALCPVVGGSSQARGKSVRAHRTDFLRIIRVRARPAIDGVAPLMTAPADPGARSMSGRGGRP
jgi:hypothetical protein